MLLVKRLADDIMTSRGGHRSCTDDLIERVLQQRHPQVSYPAISLCLFVCLSLLCLSVYSVSVSVSLLCLSVSSLSLCRSTSHHMVEPVVETDQSLALYFPVLSIS